ncbi:MAG TPA: hypothetical protein PLQ67_03580 [Burkholderiaceae bacterium]|nr:hypothetical protein [Burkholderiaceae bacterium]
MSAIHPLSVSSASRLTHTEMTHSPAKPALSREAKTKHAALALTHVPNPTVKRMLSTTVTSWTQPLPPQGRLHELA